MCYKISLLEYKAFPDGPEGVMIGGAMRRCLHVRACVLARKNASETQAAIVFAAAVDLRSLLQLDARPHVSSVEQQP